MDANIFEDGMSGSALEGSDEKLKDFVWRICLERFRSQSIRVCRPRPGGMLTRYRGDKTLRFV